MGALNQLDNNEYSYGVLLSESALAPTVYLHNFPQINGNETPLPVHIQALIAESEPKLQTLINQHHLAGRKLQLFYANPDESLVCNVQKILKVLHGMQGSEDILVPLSSCQRLVFHILRQVVPCARHMLLLDTSLLYVGDSAHRNILQAISSTCDMTFYFCYGN